VQVTLATPNGASAPLGVNQAARAPSFFLFADQYVAATHANYSAVGPASLGKGYIPVATGETFLMYAARFGEVAPGIIPGALAQAGALPSNPLITIGGLTPPCRAPANTPLGDNPVTVTYQGATRPDGMYLTVK